MLTDKRIAQIAQEPVAKVIEIEDAVWGRGSAPTLSIEWLCADIRPGTPLYAAPQPPAPCPLCARLQDELADALDVKNGHGPTALSMVIADRDALQAKVAELETSLKYSGMAATAEARRGDDLQNEVTQQSALIKELTETRDALLETQRALCNRAYERYMLIEQCEKALQHHVEMTRPLNSTDEALAAIAAHRSKP